MVGRSIPAAMERHERLNASEQRRLLAAAVPVEKSFTATLATQGLAEPRRKPLKVLQLNLGRLCNMQCSHCHVDAGPDQAHTLMPAEVVEQCLAALERLKPETVDLTGGAPELHPRFRDLVREARQQGCHVIDRCNLTVLLLPALRDLGPFLAQQQVEIVASLPQPEAEGTDMQRGQGAWEGSIAALKMLNELGYGKGDHRRVLTLMSNPFGARLQHLTSCEELRWRKHLSEKAGVSFDKLIGLNNMPIARFMEQLQKEGQLNSYLDLLQGAFNKEAVSNLMCRDTVSVSPDGLLYDCDFNQMLNVPLIATNTMGPDRRTITVSIKELNQNHLDDQSIQWDNHCFGCTAGQGSSCTGATAKDRSDGQLIRPATPQ
jgi:radical SAM/Cys-rich protein